MSDETPRLRDTMDLAISSATAQSHYPQRGPARDERQPVSWDALEALPEAVLDPIRNVAERARVWAYMLPGEHVGVEILNAPLRRTHKPLSPRW